MSEGRGPFQVLEPGPETRSAGFPTPLLAQFGLLLAAGFFGDFTIPGNSLRFVALMLAAGGCFLLAMRRISAAPLSARAFWITAVGLRLAMLGCAPCDDLWRYVWEGRIQLHGFNPYLLSPDSAVLAFLRDATWAQINHPAWPAIYPPAAELLFAATAWVSATPLAFKILFLAADLLTAQLLVKLCAGSANNGAAWYALNPAVVYAFAGAGHYDSLMLLAMTAALLVLVRTCRSPAPGGALLSAGFLGMAIALKTVPVLLIPAWLSALGRRGTVLWVCAVIPAALTIPFGGIHTVLGPLASFTEIARFNDLFWWLSEALVYANAEQQNRAYNIILAMALAAAAIRFRGDWQRSALWTMGLALVLSPVLHPWYVMWILPLACWRGARVWSILSLSSLGALLLWESTRWWSAWEPNSITRFIVIAPALFAWAWPALKRQPRIAQLLNP